MKEIGILNISDIHLGHNKNYAIDIVNNLLTMILENMKLIKKYVKLLVLTGDEFDRLLTMMNNDSRIIMSFFMKLAAICKQNNIIIRCIEGTNSHSYGQMKIIETAIKQSNIEVDFVYFSELAIEYIPSLDLNILYIPDELNGNNASKTIKQVRELLKAKQLSKVDVALMHGAFNHQLPATLESNHIEKDYIEIVRHFILIGHCHKHSVYKLKTDDAMIIAAGSPDRMCHSEEEDKGIVFALINKDNPKENSYRFLVNKYAKTFLTIKVENDDFQELIKSASKTLKSLRPDSHVRFAVDENNKVIKNNIIDLKKMFPKINFTEDKITKEAISIFNHKITKVKNIESFSITKDNIIQLINDKIKDDITGEELKILNKELEDLI